MKHSAGILLYRKIVSNKPTGFPQPKPQPEPSVEFLLVHPGGPFWANKDEHAWSIPKGEIEEGEKIEEAEKVARREFVEETGQAFVGELIPLTVLKTSNKIIHAFLGEGDLDLSKVKSNLFEMEWPPKSGRMQSFPEVDKAGWFDAETAKERIHKGQASLIDLAMEIIK